MREHRFAMLSALQPGVDMPTAWVTTTVVIVFLPVSPKTARGPALPNQTQKYTVSATGFSERRSAAVTPFDRAGPLLRRIQRPVAPQARRVQARLGVRRQSCAAPAGAGRLASPSPRRRRACQAGRAERRAASAPSATSIVSPVTSAIICAPEIRARTAADQQRRTGRAPAASSTSTPSAKEKATPSMTAKTSASRPWLGAKPREHGRRLGVVQRRALAAEIGQEHRRRRVCLRRAEFFGAASTSAPISSSAENGGDPGERGRRRQHHRHAVPAVRQRMAEGVQRALGQAHVLVRHGEDHAEVPSDTKPSPARSRRPDRRGRVVAAAAGDRNVRPSRPQARERPPRDGPKPPSPRPGAAWPRAEAGRGEQPLVPPALGRRRATSVPEASDISDTASPVRRRRT